MKRGKVLILTLVVLVLLIGGIFSLRYYSRQKYVTYVELATTRMEVSICENIKNLPLLPWGNQPFDLVPILPMHVESCYAQVADYMRDPKICEKIVENYRTKMWCYVNTAFGTSNPEICANMPEEAEEIWMTKGACIEATDINVTDIPGLEETEEDD